MKKLFLFGCIAILFFSCTSPQKPPLLRQGTWRGVLTLNDSTDLILPFNFDLSLRNDSTIIAVHNAEENISVTEISFKNDSVSIRMPLFDSEFRCKLSGDSLLTGSWINYSRKDKNTIPFTAVYGQKNRFDCPEIETNYPFAGKWKCLFSPTLPDSFYAIGVFKQAAHTITGTFMTETGDFRYLEGSVFGKYMLLSCFDGSHAFVFHAEIMEDSTIWGELYGGTYYHTTWIAWKDSTFKLRNPDSLTFLKNKSSKIDFSFPNEEGKKISLSDPKFKNKVVILQITGSWCPNCMDETMFLSDLYRKYKMQGVEIVALAFEKSDNLEKAKSSINRLKKKYNAAYEFLITGLQPKEVDNALPMIQHVMSFPTTIFIDKKGNVRKIRTGYAGPATGKEYELSVKEMRLFVESLLKESY